MDNRQFYSGASANPPAAPAAPSAGYPTDGDPLAPVPPTVPGAWWLHQIGEELRAVIVAAGLTPDDTTLTQLLTALRSAGVFQTAAQFDSSTKGATTEFVQRRGIQSAGLTAIGTSIAIPLTAMGGTALLNSAGPFAPVVPAANSVPAGTRLYCVNANSGDATLTCSGGDAMPSGTEVILRSGDTLAIESDGVSYWYFVGGSAALRHSYSFYASLAPTGEQRLPSGKIEKWGSIPSSATAVTFPVAFPVDCDRVFIFPDQNNANPVVGNTVFVATQNAAGFTRGASGISGVYLAIGH